LFESCGESVGLSVTAALPVTRAILRPNLSKTSMARQAQQ
jgi:hypothetical protein